MAHPVPTKTFLHPTSERGICFYLVGDSYFSIYLYKRKKWLPHGPEDFSRANYSSNHVPSTFCWLLGGHKPTLKNKMKNSLRVQDTRQ